MRGEAALLGELGVELTHSKHRHPLKSLITTEKLSSRPEQNEPQSGSFCGVEGPASRWMGNGRPPPPPCRFHIRPREILPLEQKRLPFGFRQRIGKAITKIQFGGMAAGFPEVAIGLAGDASLHFGDWLNRDLSYLDQLIKAAAGPGDGNSRGKPDSCAFGGRDGSANQYHCLCT